GAASPAQSRRAPSRRDRAGPRSRAASASSPAHGDRPRGEEASPAGVKRASRPSAAAVRVFLHYVCNDASVTRRGSAMPYAEGRVFYDADSHLMETSDWL